MQENEEINHVLRVLDEDRVNQGAPIFSVLVVHDDPYLLSSVFWESVRKYNLRKAGESDREMIDRIRTEAYEWAEANPQD